MALSSTARGTGSHNTSALTFTLSPGSNFSGGAGAMAVLLISADNSDSSGAAHSTFTVTDTLGNTWTRRASPLYDPGTASSGVEGAIFTSPMGGGALTTGTTITVTFDANATAKAWALWEVNCASGFTVTYDGTGNGTGSATNAPTVNVTTPLLASGDIIVAGLFNEYGTEQVVTADSDTTNGSWSSAQTVSVGSTATGQTISSQTKVVNATGTQTYNPTLGTSSDVILSWIILSEVADPASTLRGWDGSGWW